MPEKVMPGPVEDLRGVREAVCIHTRKIYDSCRDKDCIEDLRFYPKLQYVDVINRALSVKGGSAKLLYVYVDVEPVSFNRGFYTVDMRFFYSVTLQAYLSCPAPVTVEGLCVFDKRAILFGSEGNAKIFSSELRTGEPDLQLTSRSNLPIAVVEVIALNWEGSEKGPILELFQDNPDGPIHVHRDSIYHPAHIKIRHRFKAQKTFDFLDATVNSVLAFLRSSLRLPLFFPSIRPLS